MLKRILVLGAIVIAFAFSIIGHPQKKSAQRFQVYVDITADEGLKPLIESHIKRELRSLQDVDLVYARDEISYEVRIVVVEVETVSGYKTGNVACAVNFLRPFNNRVIEQYARSKEVWDTFINPLTSGLYFSPDLWVVGASRSDLGRLCQELVANFDAKHLEPERVAIKIGREMAKEWVEEIKQREKGK